VVERNIEVEEAEAELRIDTMEAFGMEEEQELTE
jgi:hypothetical protein